MQKSGSEGLSRMLRVLVKRQVFLRRELRPNQTSTRPTIRRSKRRLSKREAPAPQLWDLFPPLDADIWSIPSTSIPKSRDTQRPAHNRVFDGYVGQMSTWQSLAATSKKVSEVAAEEQAEEVLETPVQGDGCLIPSRLNPTTETTSYKVHSPPDPFQWEWYTPLEEDHRAVAYSTASASSRRRDLFVLKMQLRPFWDLPYELKDLVLSFILDKQDRKRALAPINEVERLRTEMIRRSRTALSGPDRDFKPFVRQALDFGRDLDVDPFKPPPFVYSARVVHSSRKAVDRLIADDPLFDDPDTHQKIDYQLAVQKEHLARLYRIFARSIGVPVDREYSFEKKDHDLALMRAFGTAECDATGEYRTPGMLTPLFVEDKKEAARAFSLYLGRKALVAHDPRDARNATLQFLDDACTPPPPLTQAQRVRKAAMIKLLRQICKVAFYTKGHTPNPRPPNSGKACLEVPRSKGGKRTAVYLRQTDDDPLELRFSVTPKSILTGGKLRPVTICSMFQERYSWINDFMFSRIRRFGPMIAGRSVESWVGGTNWDQLPRSFEAVSGDLEKATTLFSGDFARAAIDELAQAVGLSQEDQFEILSGLTDSEFLFEGEKRKQVRGQNLGSDASFPILCLVSMIIGFETWGDTDRLLQLSLPDLKDQLKAESRFGVNGDDFVSLGPPGMVFKWKEAVACTSGVPCLPKSPCSSRMFTVNSEIWVREERWERAPFVSPALLFNLCERLKTPQKSWLDVLDSPILDKDLGLGHIIYTDVPVVMGGLGEGIPGEGKFWARRMEFARRWVDVGVDKFMDYESPVELHVRNKTQVTLQFSSADRPSVRVSGFVKLQDFKKYAWEEYRLRHILEWSSHRSRFDDFWAVRRSVLSSEIAQRERQKKFPGGSLGAYHLIEQAEEMNYCYEHGLVKVVDKKFFRPIQVLKSIRRGTSAEVTDESVQGA